MELTKDEKFILDRAYSGKIIKRYPFFIIALTIWLLIFITDIHSFFKYGRELEDIIGDLLLTFLIWVSYNFEKFRYNTYSLLTKLEKK
jgi:hypothetical protein